MNLETKYDPGSELGRGATARVLTVRPKSGKGQYALKIMLDAGNPAETASEGLRLRFLQEGKTLARLNHRHIPKVIEIGTWHSAPAITMELIRGQRLFEYIQAQPPLREAVQYMAQVTDALHYAHSQGVVHRDIKPDNILISPAGAYLMDFGVARQEESVLKTSDGTMLGTIAYMAPEQLYNSAQADARSDIYSLGVLMYELFTGQLPFDGASPAAVILKVFNSEPVPPMEVAPHLPPQLADLILACLQKQPAERMQTARQIQYALEEIARALGSRPEPMNLNQTHPGAMLRTSQPLSPQRRTLGDLEGLRASKARQNLNLKVSLGGSFNQFGLFVALSAAIGEGFTGGIKVKAAHPQQATLWFKGVVWFSQGVIQHAQLIRDSQNPRADLLNLLSTPEGKVQRAENTPVPAETLTTLDSEQLLAELALELGFEWRPQACRKEGGAITHLYAPDIWPAESLRS